MKSNDRSNPILSKKHSFVFLNRGTEKYMMERKDDLVFKLKDEFVEKQLEHLILGLKEELARLKRRTIDLTIYENLFGKSLAINDFEPRLFSNLGIKEVIKKHDLYLGDSKDILNLIKRHLFNRLDLLIRLSIEQMSLSSARTLRPKHLELPLRFLTEERNFKSLQKQHQNLQNTVKK